MWHRRHWLILVILLFVAVAFRISVAHWLANDNPDDGRVYAQLARDILEQHVYSLDASPPYEPTLIRTPGYPLFIAAVYAVFGHTNNGALRITEGLIDSATCVLVALLAFIWQPDETQKVKTALIALGFAAVNPFTVIYSATILPEVPTMFFAVATCVTASLALRSADPKRQIKFWAATGLLAGAAVMFRSEIGLFAAAIGITLVVRTLPKFRARIQNAIVMGATFSLVFIVALLPWTVRNWRTFHRFQPLAPAHAEMPDEFIPRGYNRWLKTWLDDPQYIDPMEWELDVAPINVDDLPDSAFDSDQERDRVAALFEKYNHPPESANAATQPAPTPEASPTPNPEAKSANSTKSETPQPSPEPGASASPEENAGQENDNSSNEGGEKEESDKSNEPDMPHGAVEMTPEIDQEFGQIAAERIARHPFRYYLLMPARRARALWFNTHSDFYPFEGTLLPLEDLDYEIHQQIWLPLFALLVAVYTVAGIGGGFVLWASRDFYARLWLLLISLIIILRLGFLSTLENPEPRYVVEFFPFLAALAGIGVARLFSRTSDVSDPNGRVN